jgi:hypothetical protein
MLHDMLDPPELADEDGQALEDSMAAEHAAAMDDQGLDGARAPS